MFWFKHCPRCSGDIYEDQDSYGKFITCMQCGLTKDAPESEGGVLVISAAPMGVLKAPISDGNKRGRISHGGRHYFRSSPSTHAN